MITEHDVSVCAHDALPTTGKMGCTRDLKWSPRNTANFHTRGSSRRVRVQKQLTRGSIDGPNPQLQNTGPPVRLLHRSNCQSCGTVWHSVHHVCPLSWAPSFQSASSRVPGPLSSQLSGSLPPITSTRVSFNCRCICCSFFSFC